jgi:hypothetical protein
VSLHGLHPNEKKKKMRYLVLLVSDDELTSAYAVPLDEASSSSSQEQIDSALSTPRGAWAQERDEREGLSTPQVDASLRRVLFTRGAECAVCLAPHERTAAELTCGHSFHRQCIERWLRISANCPICRATVGTGRAPS